MPPVRENSRDEIADLRPYAIALRITIRQAELLHCLYTRKVLSPEDAARLFGGAAHSKVLIYKLRHRLPDSIKICSGYGVGYWLDTKGKAEIAARLKELEAE